MGVAVGAAGRSQEGNRATNVGASLVSLRKTRLVFASYGASRMARPSSFQTRKRSSRWCVGRS